MGGGGAVLCVNCMVCKLTAGQLRVSETEDEVENL